MYVCHVLLLMMTLRKLLNTPFYSCKGTCGGYLHDGCCGDVDLSSDSETHSICPLCLGETDESNKSTPRDFFYSGDRGKCKAIADGETLKNRRRHRIRLTLRQKGDATQDEGGVVDEELGDV